MIAADERLKDWEIELERRATEQVTDHEWGQSFINPSLPLIWDLTSRFLDSLPGSPRAAS